MSLKFIDKNGQEVSIAGKGISGKDGEGIHAGSILGYSGSREDIPEGYEVVDSNIFVSTDSLPIGAGMDYFGTTAPANYMFADGSAISRTEYAELFAVIGTTYGAGDGSTTFNLPDKRERVAISAGGEDWYLGKTGGSLQHRHTQAGWTGDVYLSNAQLPKLSGRASGVVTWDSHAYGIFTATKENTAYMPTGGTNINYTTLDFSIGGGQGHAHTLGSTDLAYALPPYLVCNYIIKVKNNNVDTAYDLIMADLGGAY